MKFNVLIFADEFPPFLGGAGTYSYELARGLASRGHKATVIAPDYSEVGIIEEIPPTMRVVRRPRIPIPGFTNLVNFFYVIVFYLLVRPEVCLIAYASTNWVYALFSIFSRVQQLLCVVYGNEALQGEVDGIRARIKEQSFRLILKKSDAIIAISQYTASLLKGYGYENKIHIVYPGIRLSKWLSPQRPETAHTLKKNFGFEGKKVILTVARLSRRKGQDIVIKALARIVNSHPDVRYLIVGAGEYETHLKQLARDLGVEDYVVFAGRVNSEEIVAIYDLG